MSGGRVATPRALCPYLDGKMRKYGLIGRTSAAATQADAGSNCLAVNCGIIIYVGTGRGRDVSD